MSHEPAEWDVQETLIARLRREVEVRDDELAMLRGRLDAAELELEDLRAIRDALTPPELPRRPGLELAAAFLPAEAERVSGDFYLVAEGPQDSTLLVIGDVVGHGLQAGRRAAFVSTTFAATAPFSDDPWRLLSWANTALAERAGASTDFGTAACVTFHPRERMLRRGYAGHPPVLWMHNGRQLGRPQPGISARTRGGSRRHRGVASTARPREHAAPHRRTDRSETRRQLLRDRGRERRARGAREPLPRRSHRRPAARVADFAYGALTDDLCTLAARIR